MRHNLMDCEGERARTRNQLCMFQRALTDVLDRATISLGTFSNDGFRMVVRAGRLNAPDGGYVLILSRRSGQNPYVCVYGAEDFARDPARFIGTDGVAVANGVLIALRRRIYAADHPEEANHEQA